MPSSNVAPCSVCSSSGGRPSRSTLSVIEAIEQLTTSCPPPSGSAYLQPTKRSGSAPTRPSTVRPLPGSTSCAPCGVSRTTVERVRSIPPSRCSSPSAYSTPLPIHGVVTGPSLIRPIAASRYASPSESNAVPFVQIQRSACSPPQLWPTMPAQPSTSISWSPTLTRPLNVVRG